MNLVRLPSVLSLIALISPLDAGEVKLNNH